MTSENDLGVGDGQMSLTEDVGSPQQVTESGTDGSCTLKEPKNTMEMEGVFTSVDNYEERKNVVKADSSSVKDTQDSVAVHKELDHPILRSLLKETADPKQREQYGIVERPHGKRSGQMEAQCRKHTAPIQYESEKEPSVELSMIDATELEHGEGDGYDNGLSMAPCCRKQDEEKVNTAHLLVPYKCRLMPAENLPSFEKEHLSSTNLNSAVKIPSLDTDNRQLSSPTLPTSVSGMSYDNGKFIDTDKVQLASTTIPVPVSKLSFDNDIIIDTGQDDYEHTPIPHEVLRWRFSEDNNEFTLDEPPPAKKFCR